MAAQSTNAERDVREGGRWSLSQRLKMLVDEGLIRRVEEMFPPKGGAPEPPPLPEIALITDRREGRGWLGYALTALAGAGAVWGAMAFGWIG